MHFISINMALLLKIVHIYTVIHVCAIVTNLTLRSATGHALHIIISLILAGKNTIVILWYVHSVFVDSGEAFCSD